jgi:hypothetical protein
VAYIKIKFHKDSDRMLDYAHRGRKEIDPYHAELVSRGVDRAKWEFRMTRDLYNATSPNECIHIIQSFHPLDTPNLTALQAVLVGSETARRAFPGHQFHVVPHTDLKHIHNHIIVNTVHQGTGAVIMNKKRHLYAVRELSNAVCKEHGLRTIEEKSKTRDPALPGKTLGIAKRGGFSYVIDLKQKATFALAHANNFKEYEEILGSFGISVKATEKNLTYFYPDTKQGKRGDRLGRQFANEAIENLFAQKSFNLSKPNDVPLAGAPQREAPNTATQAAPAFKSLSALFAPSRVALENSVVPKDEILRASSLSVEEYAKRKKIELVTDSSARLVMKEKPFLEIQGNRWINHRNGTQGNLIDFVFAFERCKSYTHALCSITGNQDLLKAKELAAHDDKFRAFVMKDEKNKVAVLEKIRRVRSHGTGKHPKDGKTDIEQASVFDFLEELEKKLPGPEIELGL